MKNVQDKKKTKEAITFGSQVLDLKHDTLRMQITNLGGGGTYPGLSEQFGRKKTKMFDNIINSVWQRTSTWSCKYLTFSGKETFIKYIGISMPVYSMSCFKIPTQVTDEITFILRCFWWEKDDKNKGVPCVAWTKLQESKKHSGLSFKDLQIFNDALLAKQAWRILRNPECLLVRLLKAH